jgi:hypothetical protein
MLGLVWWKVNGGVLGEKSTSPQRLKPIHAQARTARLKSCPDVVIQSLKPIDAYFQDGEGRPPLQRLALRAHQRNGDHALV